MFIGMNDIKKLGLEEVKIEGVTLYGVSYDGYIVTELAKTPEQCVNEASEFLADIVAKKTVEVRGYALTDKVSPSDVIVYTQNVRTTEGLMLVAFTISGAIIPLIGINEPFDSEDFSCKTIAMALGAVASKLQMEAV